MHIAEIARPRFHGTNEGRGAQVEGKAHGRLDVDCLAPTLGDAPPVMAADPAPARGSFDGGAATLAGTATVRSAALCDDTDCRIRPRKDAGRAREELLRHDAVARAMLGAPSASYALAVALPWHSIEERARHGFRDGESPAQRILQPGLGARAVQGAGPISRQIPNRLRVLY
jgi:hypothetical protein